MDDHQGKNKKRKHYHCSFLEKHRERNEKVGTNLLSRANWRPLDRAGNYCATRETAYSPSIFPTESWAE